MAQYVTIARTNYFRVQDLDAFKADLARHHVTVCGWDNVGWGELVLDNGTGETSDSIALFGHDGWPFMGEQGILDALKDGEACSAYEPLTDDARRPGEPETFPEGQTPCNLCHEPESSHTKSEPTYETLPELVAAHLVDGDVAVFMEVGFEKMRFLVGQAVAINAAGEHRTVSLDDIYASARDLGSTVTDATY